eukprot:scaffold364971_cov17-Prasinocladus_malaysianus.AAC.1
MERMVSGSLDDTPEHPNAVSGRPCHVKRFILPISLKIPEIPVQNRVRYLATTANASAHKMID